MDKIDKMSEILRTEMLAQEQYSNMIEPWIKQREMTEQVVVPIQQILNPIHDSMADVIGPMQAFYEQHSGMIEALQSVAKTPELLGLQSDLIANNLSATLDYVKDIISAWKISINMEDVLERSIAAQNIAFLRLTPDYRELALPRGGKKAIRGLTKSAAKKVTQTDDILFDPKDGEYFHKNSPDNKVSADGLSVAESSIELFAEISFSDLVEFESLLLEDLTFAFAKDHRVGAKIYNIIRGWTEFINFDKDTYFHARALGENAQAYLDQDMLKAPRNIASHGRYNAIGKSCYYFAESCEGAVKEIRKHSGNKRPTIQVAELRPVRSIRLIDLSEKISKKNQFMEHMRYAVDNDDNSLIKQRYLLPNYVASCCKNLGIDGIKYLSGDYACYVTWNDDYFEFVNRQIIEPEE